jgi:hypothetical protein
LGHTQASTTNRYAHLDADPVRRATQTISDTISAAVDGKLKPEASEGKPTAAPKY